MKISQLIELKHREDFGHEWYIQVLNIKGWSLLQASVSWNDYPSWPYIQIKSGSGSTISVLFWAYRFGFDIGLIERTWKWDYMEDVDFTFDEDDNVQQNDQGN
jgi:hypothetical protein